MAIVGVPYERPTDRHAGVQADGMLWLPRLTSAEFTRFTVGDVSFATEAHTYTGPSSWGDGASEPVGRAGHVIDGAEARDLVREVYDELEVIIAAVERVIARRVGGTVVPNPKPEWVSQPMELPPPGDGDGEPEGEPEGGA